MITGELGLQAKISHLMTINAILSKFEESKDCK